MIDTSDLILEIAVVSSADTPDDRIAELREKVRGLERAAKEVREIMDWAMLAHIEATGRDIIIGETRYYAGFPKTTRCLSVKETVDATWQAIGGDVSQFCATLRSDPFKPSACREVLPPAQFARLFETTEKMELREGKPQKRLLAASTRYGGGGIDRDDSDD